MFSNDGSFGHNGSCQQNSYERHPLAVSYNNLELEEESAALDEYSSAFVTPCSKPSSSKAFVLLCGFFLVGLSLWRASVGNGEIRINLPEIDDQFEGACGLENIQTLQGALACEAACSVASCCHDQCWESNKSLCLQYHHACIALDGVAFSTGEPHNLLPANYKGGWFQQIESKLQHHHDGSKQKKARPSIFSARKSFPLLNAKEARSEACQGDPPSNDNFRNCIHLCIPAACCYDDIREHPDTCRSVSGQTIQCMEYSACDVLY